MDPEETKRSIYVKYFTPPQDVSSTLEERNIIEINETRNNQYFLVVSVNPKSQFMAMKSADGKLWRESELKTIYKMKKFNIGIKNPKKPRDSPISSTWVYLKNLVSENQIIEYKARICAQGFEEEYGASFEHKYAPTGKLVLLCILFTFSGKNFQLCGWKLGEPMDIPSTITVLRVN